MAKVTEIGAFLFKYGSNRAISSSSVWAAIHQSGGTLAHITTPDKFRIKLGGDPLDKISAANAQKIIVHFLDEDGNPQFEIIDTNGALVSLSSTLSLLRFVTACVYQVGTYGGTNKADIVIETDGGVALATIPAGVSRTRVCASTVPNKTKAYIKSIFVNVGGSKSADIRFCYREDSNIVAGAMKPTIYIPIAEDLTGDLHREGDRFPLEAFTDFWIEAKLHTGSGTTAVNAEIVGSINPVS